MADPRREFLEQMSESIRLEKTYDWGPIFGLVGVFIAIGLVASGFYLWRNRTRIRGLVIRLQRRARGLPVAKDRVVRRFYVLIDPGQGPGRVLRTTTEDMSPSGMFVRTPDPLPEKQIFSYKMELTDFGAGVTRTIKGRAEVRWVKRSWPRGMGCQFLDFDEAEKNRLRSFLQKRKQSS